MSNDITSLIFNFQGKSLFMSTVEHTATSYFLSGLQRKLGTIRFQHCYPNTIDIANKKGVVFTTYRDPYRVAASWYNRGKLNNQDSFKRWRSQWNIYWQLREMNPIIFDVDGGREQHGFVFDEEPKNSHADELGLHKALDNQDFDYFHSVIPERVINSAKRGD